MKSIVELQQAALIKIQNVIQQYPDPKGLINFAETAIAHVSPNLQREIPFIEQRILKKHISDITWW
jgi:hypothetical protein